MHFFPKIRFKITKAAGNRCFTFSNGFTIEKQNMKHGPIPFYYHVCQNGRMVGINFKNFDSAYLFMMIKAGLLITISENTGLVRTKAC